MSWPEVSNLVMLDPSQSLSTVVYPKGGRKRFFTDTFGEQQLLASGNYLITESHWGRVFEASCLRSIAWNIVLPYDETYASLIAIARRFLLDYFAIDDRS